MTHLDATTLSLLALGETVDFDSSHAWSCQRCGDELAGLRRVVDAAVVGDLSDEEILALPAVAPPVHVWERIQAEMHTPCGERQQRRIVWPNWGVAASVVLGLVLGAGAIDIASGVGPGTSVDAGAERTVATVAMRSLGEGGASASGVVVRDGDTLRLRLQTADLRRTATNRYQLWLRDASGTTRIHLGDLTGDSGEFAVPEMDLSGLVLDIAMVPGDGNPAFARQVLSGGMTIPTGQSDPLSNGTDVAAGAPSGSPATVDGSPASGADTPDDVAEDPDDVPAQTPGQPIPGALPTARPDGSASQPDSTSASQDPSTVDPSADPSGSVRPPTHPTSAGSGSVPGSSAPGNSNGSGASPSAGGTPGTSGSGASSSPSAGSPPAGSTGLPTTARPGILPPGLGAPGTSVGPSLPAPSGTATPSGSAAPPSATSPSAVPSVAPSVGGTAPAGGLPGASLPGAPAVPPATAGPSSVATRVLPTVPPPAEPTHVPRVTKVPTVSPRPTPTRRRVAPPVPTVRQPVTPAPSATPSPLSVLTTVLPSSATVIP